MDLLKNWTQMDGAAIFCHMASPPGVPPEVASYTTDFTVLLTAPPMFSGHTICWKDADERAFEDLLAGWRGDPLVLGDAAGRMLYFSVTTVTTIGYGDVVPLSDLARLLAGVQAVFGWVVAGFFLNAVAWRANSSAPPHEVDATSPTD